MRYKPLQKKVVIQAGVNLHQFWLCGVALQHFASGEHHTDSERTYYNKYGTERVHIRERETIIQIRYQRIARPNPHRKGVQLC